MSHRTRSAPVVPDPLSSTVPKYDSTYGNPAAAFCVAAPAFAGPALASAPLAASALWLVSSNVLFAACQWASVVALAKLGAPVALGHLGLALAVATPVVLVTGFALRAYQATDVFRRYAFAAYLSLRLLANVVAGAVIVTAAVVSGLDAAAFAVVIPIGAAKLAEATSETCYGLAQRHDRMRFVAVSRMARGACGQLGLVTVVARGGTLADGAWALAAVWTAFLVAVDLPVASGLEPIFVRTPLATLGRLARESAPLGAVNGVFAVSQSLPRYLLQGSHGPAAVGYYTALAAVVPALSQLATAVCHAAAPRLGWTAATDAGRYRVLVGRLLGLAVLVSLLLTAGAALLGRGFLALAYADDYAAYHGTFVAVVLAAGLGVVNEVQYFALLAVRKLRAQLVIQSVGLGVTALAGLALVPRFGVGGAAGAAVLAGAATAAVGAWALLGRGSER